MPSVRQADVRAGADENGDRVSGVCDRSRGHGEAGAALVVRRGALLYLILIFGIWFRNKSLALQHLESRSLQEGGTRGSFLDRPQHGR